MKPFKAVLAGTVLVGAFTVLPASTASAGVICDYWPTACGEDPNTYVKISQSQQARRASEPSAWDQLFGNMSEPNDRFWFKQETTSTETRQVPRFSWGSESSSGGGDTHGGKTMPGVPCMICG